MRKLPYQGYRFLRGEDSGEIYWNIWVDSLGQAFLVSKNSGKKRPLKSPVATCTRGEAHKDVTCCTCHTAWAPQCVGCHTAYNPDVQSYDLLDKEKKAGKWEEFLGGFMADPPALGVIEKSKLDDTQVRTIMMFIPGMIMTMDASLFPGKQEKAESFHRLFAPAAPHTTSAVGRTCASCHLDPLAIGYGRGKIGLPGCKGQRALVFYPEYAATPQDGLPQDAWIAFCRSRPVSSLPGQMPGLLRWWSSSVSSPSEPASPAMPAIRT
ncbi:MAG: hypothetical protein IPL49_20805 [Saprospirales bacterium]|nr:hypothetical protein [Saprospirales bacterium]